MSKRTIAELIEALIYAPDGWSVEADILIDELLEYGESAIQPLIYDFLADPGLDYGLDNTYEVVMALKQLGDTTTDAFIKALTDENMNVRHIAARALGDIGDKRALSALENEMLTNKSYSAVIGIAQIGGDDAARMLLNALKTTDLDRRYVIGWLGRTGSKLVLKTLIDALQDEDTEVRRVAIFEHRFLALPDSREPLLTTMHNDTSSHNRYYAAYVLASTYHDSRAASAIAKNLSDKLASTRESAIGEITQSGNLDYVEEIYQSFKHDKELSVQLVAAHSLIAFDTPYTDEAIKLIEKFLSNKEASLRLKAFYPLRSIQHQMMFGWLKQMRHDEDPYLRFCVTLILGEQCDREHLDFLKSWHQHEQHRLVKKALVASIESIESRHNDNTYNS